MIRCEATSSSLNKIIVSLVFLLPHFALSFPLLISSPGKLWHRLSSGVLPVSISDLEGGEGEKVREQEKDSTRKKEESSDNTRTGCFLCNMIASPKKHPDLDQASFLLFPLSFSLFCYCGYSSKKLCLFPDQLYFIIISSHYIYYKLLLSE